MCIRDRVIDLDPGLVDDAGVAQTRMTVVAHPHGANAIREARVSRISLEKVSPLLDLERQQVRLEIAEIGTEMSSMKRPMSTEHLADAAVQMMTTSQEALEVTVMIVMMATVREAMAESMITHAMQTLAQATWDPHEMAANPTGRDKVYGLSLIHI